MRGSRLSVLLTLLLVAGCGDGDDEEVVVDATPAAVAAAGQETLREGSARFEIELTMDLSGFGLSAGEPIELTGEGVTEFGTQRMEMTLDLGAMVAALGDQLPSEAASMFDEPMRQVMDGTVMYQCAEFFELVAGGSCVRFDFAELIGAEAATQLGGLGGGTDPSALLQSLRGAEDAEEIGTEEVAGVETTHLRGSLTVAEAMANTSGDAAEELSAAFERLGLPDEARDTPMSYDVWIDGDGLVRQLRQEIDLGAVVGGGSAPISFEIRFVEFGVDVDIDVPTDFVDATDLPGFPGG